MKTITNTIENLSNQTLLVIMDGYGINENTNKNAVKDAHTPTLDNLFSNYPYTTIEAGGIAVGLPKGISGNSEVGHMNIGAGSPVRQDLVRINESIEKNEFIDLPLLKNMIKIAQASSKKIHLIGLLSDGGVHSHIDHLKYIIKYLNQYPELKIYFHGFSDGRDTQRDCVKNYINDLADLSLDFSFSSICGRSIGMDRDQRWEKIEVSYHALTSAKYLSTLNPCQYVDSEYQKGRYDEFIEPALFDKNGIINNDDCVFFINFRPDRAIQMTLAMTDPNFIHFKREIKPKYFLCMTPYVQDQVELPILFDKEPLKGGLCEYLSKKNLKQYKIAETEKYAHITYFFNGGKKEAFENESQVLVPSSKEVSSYDQKPQMSAPLITEKLLQALDLDDVSFYLVNFANSDMVGHTGNYQAAVKAVETLDKSIEQLHQKCLEKNITLIITADHGNSDRMVYDNGKIHTSHTNAQVPFCVINNSILNTSISLNGSEFALKDVAPTVLYTLGLQAPNSFTGKNIFI